MALLKFKKGQYANLPSTKSEGTVYITTDEKAMYVDISNTERIRIGQIVELTSTEWANTKPPYDSNVFYYLTDKNALIKWNAEAEDWIQINSTASLAERISALETTVGDANSGLVKTVGSHTTEINTLKDALNNTTTGLKKRVTDLETGLGQANENIANLELNKIAKIKISGAASDLAMDADKRVTLGKLAAVGAKVAKSDLASDVTTELSNLNTAIGTKVSQTDYNAKMASLDGSITNINTSIGDINATIGNDFSKTNTITAAVQGIKTRLTDVEGVNTSQNTRLGTLETFKTNQENTNNTLNQGITAAQNAADAAQGAADAAQAAAEAAQETADQGVTDAATAQAAAEAAQSTANTAKTTANTNKQNIEALTPRVTDLENTRATKTELQNAKDELQGKITTNATNISNNSKAIQTNAGNISGNTTAINNVKTDIKDVVKPAIAKNTEDIGKNATAIKDIVDNKLPTKVDKTTYDAALGTEGTVTKAVAKNATDIGTLNTNLNKLKSDIGNLSNIMNFRGVTTTDPTSKVTIGGTVITDIKDGDVVIYGDKEYVYSNSAWHEFGDGSGNANAISRLDERLTALDKEGGRIALVEGRVTTLEGTVGNSTKGLVKDVADNKTAIANNKKDIEDINSQITWGSF